MSFWVIWHCFFLNKGSKFNNFFVIPKLDFNDRYILNEAHIINNTFKQNQILNNKYQTEYQIFIHSIHDGDSYYLKAYLINNLERYLISEIKTKKINFNIFFNEINKKALNQWKTINQINTSITNNLECQININNINELSHVRSLLKNNKMIKNINLISIKLNENIYKLTYYGSFDIFKNYLNKIRLELSLNDKYCNIKLK